MNIIQSSIKDLGWSQGPVEDLSTELSTGAVIDLGVRTFDYEINVNQTFEFKDLQTVFYDIPQADQSSTESFNYLKGILKPITLNESKIIIDLHIFCSGNEEQPISKSRVPEKFRTEAQDNVNKYWSIIEQYYSSSPTRVYQYFPDMWSTFSGIYWSFCFIYLDDKTGKGIVLAGNSCD